MSLDSPFMLVTGHDCNAGPQSYPKDRLRKTSPQPADSGHMRQFWDNEGGGAEIKTCIYCSQPADSLEHPLPAAFGEFSGAPMLRETICKSCNNTRLGVLDEQLVRCGPEAFFRRLYGVQGRAGHDLVNPFYRGSAGGRRLEMKATDSNLGIDVLLEIDKGIPRQARQIVFTEESGKTHHLPIREGISPAQLKAAFDQLGVVQPCSDVRIFYGPEEKEWVLPLIKQTWPSVTFGDGDPSATTYRGAVGTVGLTDRYFRAIAKIGFHYFLTQFSQYTGHELIFAGIREFIADGAGGVDAANQFVGKRPTPLLGAMLTPGIRPVGWVAHVLCAEIKPGECLAYVQLFLSEDWDAPIYAVRLASDPTITGLASAGHFYAYENDAKGKYAGEASSLLTARSQFPPAPFKPVILSPSAE